MSGTACRRSEEGIQY